MSIVLSYDNKKFQKSNFKSDVIISRVLSLSTAKNKDIGLKFCSHVGNKDNKDIGLKFCSHVGNT